MFTHHQKTIVVDSEVDGSLTKRRIVSFLGGIDLCDGRYDTVEHPLFGTLNSVHANDFHQPNFDGASIKKGGPREPWHDIHCKLDGPAAWDVLYNFEQRWMKQGIETNSQCFNVFFLRLHVTIIGDFFEYKFFLIVKMLTNQVSLALLVKTDPKRDLEITSSSDAWDETNIVICVFGSKGIKNFFCLNYGLLH